MLDIVTIIFPIIIIYLYLPRLKAVWGGGCNVHNTTSSPSLSLTLPHSEGAVEAVDLGPRFVLLVDSQRPLEHGQVWTDNRGTLSTKKTQT